MESEIIDIKSAEEMTEFGEKIGRQIVRGLIFELIGDVGSGKTTFTKGLAKGLGVEENVQSPSFTISRVYGGKKFNLSHYDFYRLDEPGIMLADLTENINDENMVSVIEWAQSVEHILPEKSVKIEFFVTSENSRRIKIYNFSKDDK